MKQSIKKNKSTSSARRKFNLVYEDYDQVWFSKKEYEHNFPEDEDEPKFKYRYAIKVIDMQYACGEEEFPNPTYNIALSLVISPESLCEKQYNQVKDCCGYEEYVDGKSTGKTIVDYQSVLDYGTGCVCLEDEQVQGKLRMKQVRNEMMASIGLKESFRGFEMDKVINRIGSTGWDVIFTAVGKQDDFFPWCRKKEEQS